MPEENTAVVIVYENKGETLEQAERRYERETGIDLSKRDVKYIIENISDEPTVIDTSRDKPGAIILPMLLQERKKENLN
jgi:hypothetical protein